MSVVAVLIAFYLIASGFLAVIVAAAMRLPGWGWTAVSGVFSVLVGWFVASRLATTPTWMLGALIGLVMAFSGAALIIVAHESRMSTIKRREFPKAA
jgi:uncharacterized membrane protein HdeD (DUF308 family)